MSIRNQIGAALVFAAGTFCAAQMASADHHIKSGTYEFVASFVTDLHGGGTVGTDSDWRAGDRYTHDC